MGSKRSRAAASGDGSLSALALSGQLESLRSLYDAWAEVQLQRRTAIEARRVERDQLANRTRYLLNTVSAARSFAKPSLPAPELPPSSERKGKKKASSRPSSKALSAPDPLTAFHAQAEAELEAATAALAQREAREEQAFAAQDAELRVALRRRAESHLQIHRPRLALKAHPVGSDQVIVQAESPSEEDAVLLLEVLFQRLPTRWGFFSDDGVEDFRLGSARLYADEGVTEVFPADVELEEKALRARSDFAPARLQIPIEVPGRSFPRYRLVHRGPVAEIESRREGQPYVQLIPREDSELLTGYLLSLKLLGLIQLELEVG